MEWKEFFRPTWQKIILFIAIAIIAMPFIGIALQPSLDCYYCSSTRCGACNYAINWDSYWRYLPGMFSSTFFIYFGLNAAICYSISCLIYHFIKSVNKPSISKPTKPSKTVSVNPKGARKK